MSSIIQSVRDHFASVNVCIVSYLHLINSCAGLIFFFYHHLV